MSQLKLSFGFILILSSLLAACGNGNSNQPQVGTYAYNQNGAGNNGLCPPQVALDWNNYIATPCNYSQGPGSYCGRGIEEFIRHDQAYIQGPGCALATQQMQWCSGDNWRSQQFFQVNMPILQSMLTQNGGPGSYPLNNGGPGRPNGGQGFPQH